MKRFLVFYHANYYAAGGIRDFLQSFDNLEESIDFLKSHALKHSYYPNDESAIWDSHAGHIYDSEQNKIVWDSYKNK